MSTPPDFRTLTDADWSRELPRARAQRNEVLSEIRQRLSKMTTTHETTITRTACAIAHANDKLNLDLPVKFSCEYEIPVTLTIEWSRDRRDDCGNRGPMTWWRDNMVARDANGVEIPLTSWERESFSEKYVKELP